MQSGDQNEVASLLHRIKGSSDSVGLDQLSNPAEKAEASLGEQAEDAVWDTLQQIRSIVEQVKREEPMGLRSSEHASSD